MQPALLAACPADMHLSSSCLHFIASALLHYSVLQLRVLERIDDVRVGQSEFLAAKQDVVHGFHSQHQAVILVAHFVLQ